MIQITRPGKNDKRMTGSCENCGCEVDCYERDARHGKRGQESAIVFFIECPSCGGVLYVKEKKQ